jgi:nicotinate-nucleotide--dimethylbenzimidazole phosphoribosyltransferase
MDKIKKIITKISQVDFEIMRKTQKRLDALTKPPGSLGRLEELAKLIVGITGENNPVMKNKVIFTLAGDHGVAEEGVSAYPQVVTAQMVANFLKGGAGINILAKHVGATVVVADLGVASKIPARPAGGRNSKFKTQNFRDKKIAFGTKNMARGPAMSKRQAIKSIEAGIEIFEDEFFANRGEKNIDIIGLGEMGIGNTTSSSAITAILTGKKVEETTGRGTGLDDEGLKNKIRIIKKALRVNQPDPDDVLDVLAKVGGFEIGGLVGVILAASAGKIPVVLDGFISGTAALIAAHLEPKTKNYLIAGHCSVEKGHRIILERLGLVPLLSLNLRLGEGTGAALAISLVEVAVKILTQMTTFKSAGVSEKIKS